MMFLLFLFFAFFEIASFTACPSGSIASFSDPTKCYYFESQKLNWIAAEESCKNLGGHLASIHDMLDNVFLSGEASTFFTDSASADFWIGANKLFIPGTWSWMDGTPWNFTDWDKGQPENVSDTNCACSSLQYNKWKASNCLTKKPFACLVKTNVLKSCYNTWTYFEETGFCYKVLENQNWYDAEESCKTYGAQLASTHSQQESSFLTKLSYYHGSEGCDATKIAWIGLHYNSTNKSWKWSDGSKTDFLNWMPGEPNNTDRDDCGLPNIASNCGYNSSLISDYYCNSVAARYICKMLPVTFCKISN